MKKIISILLVLTLLSFTAFAITDAQTNTADALNELGLFLGTGEGYDLENGLTRAQGITLLVRMIGMEKQAEEGSYVNSFIDVPDWASKYIGYAYEQGITKGVSETTFDSEGAMTDYMFLTLTLRALNYTDSGENAQFVWDKPYEFAKELKLIEESNADTSFTRADAVTIFWNALDTKLNGESDTLSARLIKQGVFTAKELESAKKIQENGRNENAGKPTTKPPYSGGGGGYSGGGSIITPTPTPTATPAPTSTPVPEATPTPVPMPDPGENGTPIG